MTNNHEIDENDVKNILVKITNLETDVRGILTHNAKLDTQYENIAKTLDMMAGIQKEIVKTQSEQVYQRKDLNGLGSRIDKIEERIIEIMVSNSETKVMGKINYEKINKIATWLVLGALGGYNFFK